MRIIIAGFACAVLLTVIPARAAEPAAGAVKPHTVTDSDRAASSEHYSKGMQYLAAGVYEQAGAEMRWTI